MKAKTTKKTPVKAKKTAAKAKTVKKVKAPAKVKATTKKAPAKKTPVQKAPAKKVLAKKAPAKKAPAKKVLAKKAPAKKAPAKKAAATAKGASKKRRITFTYRAEAGLKVFLSGTFNAWNPTTKPMIDKKKDGIYTASLTLAPASYEYKFVIDGTWCADPECADWVQNDHGTLNSVKHVSVS